MKTTPLAILAKDVPARRKRSNYPEPFASQMEGKEKRQLGEVFGLQNLGINLTTLAPGARSALLHRHSLQEEFIFILEGTPTLMTDNVETLLQPGMCAGFVPNEKAHCLINKSEHPVTYLEMGPRTQGDTVNYPADDLVAVLDSNQQWIFTHKNGQKY